MRDLLLTIMVFGSIPFIFVRPYVGVLVLVWLGFMSPHSLTFDFARELPYSKIIMFCTLIAFLFYKDKVLPRSSAILWMFLLYVFWSTITTLFAIYPEDAMTQWSEFMKVIAIALVVLLMTNSKHRLHMLIVVMVLSIGFYGFRGGIFTIVTGGQFTVWGPELSMMSDNNALGLALVMLLPLIWYVKGLTKVRWQKMSIYLLMALTAFAIFGTQSRGAFLGIVAMTAFLVLKSRAKFSAGIAVIVLAPILYAFMPQSWHERMDSIKNYEQDESAMMRINAWEFTINLANDHPITGGGYNSASEELFSIYSERPEIPWTGPHSIYFETLGEHGWAGLAIYLLLGLVLYRSMSYIIKQTKQFEDLSWMRDLAAMIQVSVVGFAVAGAFLELAKLDLFMMLIVITIIMMSMLKNRLTENALTEKFKDSKKSYNKFSVQQTRPVVKSPA